MTKKPFNRYTVKEAYQLLNLEELTRWEIEARPLKPSNIFHDILKRLDAFDLTSSEGGKEVLINEILQEALTRHDKLKIWKEVSLKTDVVSGRVEYVVAKRRDFMEQPFLCLAEAKKDDFEKGLAQCLVEMKACQILNLQAGFRIDVYGIVTSGFGWQFYKLTSDNQGFQTVQYAFPSQMETLLGLLDAVFAACEQNLP